MRNLRKYGWKRDLPDVRDKFFSMPRVEEDSLPKEVYLNNQAFEPPVYDQGSIGSCTGNGTAYLYQFVNNKEEKQSFFPSRLFIYFNARRAEGMTSVDAGASIRDAVKSLNVYGAASEKSWPYNVNKFAIEPDKEVYEEALDHQSIAYARVAQSSLQLRYCLSLGYPIVFGFSVYDFFESREMAQSGVLRMPIQGDTMIGGHCVAACGYKFIDPNNKLFLIRNSWGASWGQHGYFWMPEEYIINPNLSSDFWKITMVEG